VAVPCRGLQHDVLDLVRVDPVLRIGNAVEHRIHVLPLDRPGAQVCEEPPGADLLEHGVREQLLAKSVQVGRQQPPNVRPVQQQRPAVELLLHEYRGERVDQLPLLVGAQRLGEHAAARPCAFRC
jgi:hypothetical protein